MQYAYSKGNLTNKEQKKISIDELTKAHIEKKNTRKMIYENIYKQCCEKIRFMNQQYHMTSCDFIVPLIQIGMPMYKLETCVVFVMHYLKQEGFYVEFMYPNRLIISWDHALRRALKKNDKEWHKITEGGKLYEQPDLLDKGDYYGAKVNEPMAANDTTTNVDKRWDYALIHEKEVMHNVQQQEQEKLRQQLHDKQIQQEQLQRQLQQRQMEQQQLFNQQMVVSAGFPEDKDEEKEQENSRKVQVRRQKEQKYQQEQKHIADVIRRKNNEALKSLAYSRTDSSSSKPHKKFLQIVTQ